VPGVRPKRANDSSGPCRNVSTCSNGREESDDLGATDNRYMQSVSVRMHYHVRYDVLQLCCETSQVQVLQQALQERLDLCGMQKVQRYVVSESQHKEMHLQMCLGPRQPESG
jgi:hypothetical protein